MKGRLLALLLSLIVSSTAGLYAKNAASTQDTSSSESTTSVETSSADSQSAASSDTVSSEQSSTNQTGASAVSAQVSSSASSGVSSSSSQTSVQSSESSSSDTESVSSTENTSSSSQEDCYQDTYSANSSCNSTITSPNYNSYQNYNDYMNDILSQITGNNCSQTPSGDVSSQASGNVPSTSSESVSSSSPSSSSDTAAGTYADFQNQVLKLVNEERTSRGLNALTLDASLNKTATLKSEDMANLGYFDHNSPTYGSPFDMMKQFGISYQTAGENIAMGQTSPEQVMTGWMNSEGHRANILNTSFTKLGVGIAQDSSGRYYWTQQFIG
ncbi:MAG: SCP domain-containing protein [Oscillospiraceae bacterium]|jgi:uncharacterized YkwD family protein